MYIFNEIHPLSTIYLVQFFINNYTAKNFLTVMNKC